ncbi:glycerate kinase [Klenkia soli]|uniref:Glycerate kinase n=1 Tax=Klenkia soli TaxID=1052260 RepID=A0A1H0F5R7_9ACTN|nr:glycerate kinase [Klenkia soli]SDN89922.1 glycerate kinase [Klenkia soli]
MKVVLAPDKFKGTLTAAEVAAAVVAGLPASTDVVQLPVADGGEGTAAAALAAGAVARTVRVTGPTGEPVDAVLALLGDTAVVELAGASGLAVLPGGVPAAQTATSAGTGELVRAALDAGCTRIVLGVGGSACTDGGAGLLTALGARLTDAAGADLPPGGAALVRLHAVDLAGLDPRLAGTEVVLATDVDNPLLGPTGAAAVYGPQKGADPDDVVALEAGLARWAAVLGGDPDVPGAGAAGGVGFGALAVLGAVRRPGIDVVLDLVGFDAALAGADLVVTGEGSLDEQTLHGKAPAGVAARARAAGVPVVAVAGRCLLDAEQLRAAGFRAVFALADLDPDRCTTHPAELLARLAPRLIREAGPMSTIPLFVNGEGMRGGSVHPSIAGHPFLGEAATAPRYRFYSVGDRFPALWPVEEGGVGVPGELYDVPLTVIRDAFIPAEPPELELSVIELADGSAALAVVLREAELGSPELVDISAAGGWREHRGAAG